MSMLPRAIPLFPLPNTVLFPNVFLPLHIFEPRYRAMVADALEGDRLIGMVLLKPGYEVEYEGRPAVYPIGCAGVITHTERLPDGCYNIVLRGLEKFRVADEEGGKAYRVGVVEHLPELIDEAARDELHRQRQRLEAVLAAALERAGSEPRFPPAIPDDDLVNGLSQYMRLAPIERQALLERDGVLDRCRSLIDLIQMNGMAAGLNWSGRASH
ncbi:MAG: LON peptidase substrate-binding domain-containing protein [Vicinamibacterales bacterium]